MKNKKIVITGSKGNVGRILREGLEDYELALVDLPEIDIFDEKKFYNVLRGSDVVIHLAWDKEEGDKEQNKTSDKNAQMAHIVLEGCLRNNIPRVIISSSLHVHDFKQEDRDIGPYSEVKPVTPYGRSRKCIEELAEKYAKRGLEVVVVRFGRVRHDEAPEERFPENILLLKNKDVISLIRKIIETDQVEGKGKNYLIIQAVPDHPERMHSFENPLGWKPEEN